MELDDAMERTQKHFARMAALENKRYKSTLKRDKTTLKMAADDKKEAAHNLRVAVTAWQKATNSWAASTNARIDTMNKHVAANAAQIKENAKKARKDLEGAMHSWDKKIANNRNRIEMANVQKAQMAASGALSAATSAAATATSNSLKRAKKMFATKIGMLTNVVAANAKRAERDLTALTGVVHNIAKANAADRSLIRAQTAAMEADLNKAVTRAIQIGEAKAKAVEQRIAAHLKSSKRFLQVELSNQCESAADNVFKIISGKRQKIADNYLSFKAYAVSAVDKVTDYTGKGKGRNLSSIGDMLMTVGALAAVKAPKAEGLGFGGKVLPPVFSGKIIKVKGAVAKINGP